MGELPACPQFPPVSKSGLTSRSIQSFSGSMHSSGPAIVIFSLAVEGTMEVDTKVTAAIIAAVVSLIGAILTLVAARWQIRAKLDELTQAQFKDVLAKRIELYPRLWRIVQESTSDWKLAKKPVDCGWARNLMASLIAWHAECGVFLSQRAYEKFAELRARVLLIVENCEKKNAPTSADLDALDDIYSGVSAVPVDNPRHYSLATWMKNDLGSYKVPAISI